MAGATGPATSTGTAAQSAAPSKAYSGRLVALIRGNLVFTGETPADNQAAEVEVSAAASGNQRSSRATQPGDASRSSTAKAKSPARCSRSTDRV